MADLDRGWIAAALARRRQRVVLPGAAEYADGRSGEDRRRLRARSSGGAVPISESPPTDRGGFRLRPQRRRPALPDGRRFSERISAGDRGCELAGGQAMSPGDELGP